MKTLSRLFAGTRRPALSGSVVTALLSAALMSCSACASAHAARHDPFDTVQHTVVGAFPAPPKGPGSGRLDAWKIGMPAARVARFGAPDTRAGNSFYVGYDAFHHRIYVPTEAGVTKILDARTLKPVGQFDSLKNARVARITPDGYLLLELSAHRLVGYLTADDQPLFQVPVGGNALAITTDDQHVFVGGNADKHVTEVALPSGRVVHRYPIAHSGDLAWANGQLFSADMRSGVVSALNPQSGHIKRIHTPEVDPDFSYHNIAAAKAGFMQLAADPRHDRLYAAGFSGHVLDFSTARDRYLGEVPVKLKPGGPDKLSGLAVVDRGREAVVTAENRKETALIRLSNGKILRALPHTASNRWVLMRS
ncbi:MAG TPA: hypothetical protein VKA50_01675 [Gammaproteobacteria bacterium]|nr:hypothetical protein [Gammaproteobacteria bacterium]